MTGLLTSWKAALNAPLGHPHYRDLGKDLIRSRAAVNIGSVVALVTLATTLPQPANSAGERPVHGLWSEHALLADLGSTLPSPLHSRIGL